jgi:hypothetical protein
MRKALQQNNLQDIQMKQIKNMDPVFHSDLYLYVIM